MAYQLVLKAGAYSAKIVTLPGLNEGEDLVEWLGDRQIPENKDALRAELEALAADAPFVERQSDQAAVTSAPSVTAERLMRPEIGASTLV